MRSQLLLSSLLAAFKDLTDLEIARTSSYSNNSGDLFYVRVHSDRHECLLCVHRLESLFGGINIDGVGLRQLRAT